MTDPKRWSEAGNSATPDEQALVHAGLNLTMPAHDKSAVWERIVSAIPAPPVATHPAGGNATGPLAPLAGPAVIKVASLVLALVGSGVIAHRMGRPAANNDDLRAPKVVAATTSTSSPARIVAATNSTSSVPLTAAPAAVTAATVEPAGSATNETAAASAPSGLQRNAGAVGSADSGSPSSPASRLREESQAVLAVRRALHSNDVSLALSLLESARRRFGAGALNEEREALLIEALARSGEKARAAKHAKAFLSAYPRSPHAADVQRHLQK